MAECQFACFRVVRQREAYTHYSLSRITRDLDKCWRGGAV